MHQQSMTWAKAAAVATAVWLGCGCGGQTHDSGSRPSAHPEIADTNGPGDAGPAVEHPPSSEPEQGGPPGEVDVVPDPPAPNTPYGTKGEAHLFLGTQEVGYIFFTVLAPARADLAHVFFLPDPSANVAVADYSISLVLERGPWRTGAYSGSVGGRAAITLSNGAQYESQGANATLTATLDRVQVAEGGTYLDGKLTVLLDAKSGGAALRAEVQFN